MNSQRGLIALPKERHDDTSPRAAEPTMGRDLGAHYRMANTITNPINTLSRRSRRFVQFFPRQDPVRVAKRLTAFCTHTYYCTAPVENCAKRGTLGGYVRIWGRNLILVRSKDACMLRGSSVALIFSCGPSFEQRTCYGRDRCNPPFMETENTQYGWIHHTHSYRVIFD